jgi:pimeloyl-ACP methyl ester carboxylesterase
MANYSDSGHYPWLDDPARFASATVEFLEESESVG